MAGGHDDPSAALDDGAHGGASCGAKRAQPMATGRKVTPLNNRSNKPFLVTEAVVARRQTREALNPLAHQESGRRDGAFVEQSGRNQWGSAANPDGKEGVDGSSP